MKKQFKIKKQFLSVLCLVFLSAGLQAKDLNSKKVVEDDNRQVLKNMEEGGFDFSKTHVVDFYALFATQKHADAVAKLYKKEKSTNRELKTVEVNKDENGDYELLVQISMQVSYESVTKFEKKMLIRASANKGKLNGWGIFQ